jgi:hypothetical protein
MNCFGIEDHRGISIISVQKKIYRDILNCVRTNEIYQINAALAGGVSPVFFRK